MFLLVTLLFFIMFIVASSIIKNRISKIPLLIYLLWWYLLLSISSFNPYDLYPVSNKGYLLILLNVFVFFIGYISLCFKKNTNKNFNTSFEFKPIDKIIFTSQILILPVVLYYFLKYQYLLSNLGFLYARSIKYELGYLFGSSIEYIFFTFIIQPIVNITVILFCIKFMNKDIKNWTFVLMLANILLNGQIGLGRFVYFQILIYLLIIYFITKNKGGLLKLNIKNAQSRLLTKIFAFVGIFTMITFMAVTTVLRRGFDKITLDNLLNEGYYVLFEQAIVYFIGPFRAFDGLLDSSVLSDFGLFWGRLTFGGIDQLLGYLFKLVDPTFLAANSLIGPITRSSVFIGNDQGFNAFYTSLLNYYLDLNIVGILVFPLLYGMFSAFIVNGFIKKKSLSLFILLLFITYNSIASSLRWEYQFPETWIVIFLLFISNLRVKRIKSF